MMGYFLPESLIGGKKRLSRWKFYRVPVEFLAIPALM